MPIVIVNGHRVQQVPGMQDLDLGPANPDEKEGQKISLNDVGKAPPQSMMQRVLHTLGNLSPEIAATGAALGAPETAGLSLILPPLAAGATEVGREYLSGEPIDAGKVLTRTGLNAIPGVVGKVAGRFMGAVPRALEAAGQGNNAIASLARGAGALVADPVADAAGEDAIARSTPGAVGRVARNIERLKDPTLNSQAKAALVTGTRNLQAARASSVADKIRSIIAGYYGVSQ